MKEIDSQLQAGERPSPLLPWLAIPLLALLVVAPLCLHGPSCGHDFGFHIQSWLDAAQQMRRGTLDPQWAFSPAWNAGEPRFIFYPPASWMLGSILSFIVPIGAVPIVFTWIALSAAGLSMYRLARALAPPRAALLASAVYLANPYMLFTAFERTAYGELLAAAWLPLLLLAALEDRPTMRAVAVPIALLWLTNAPAAVIGCYGFALAMAVRLALRLPAVERALRHAPGAVRRVSALRLIAVSGAGALWGVGLAAFYFLPAAFERRYVQIAMAIIPNMRYQDNFLFGGTGDADHDAVLRTASSVSVLMLVLTVMLLLVFLLHRRSRASARQSLSGVSQAVVSRAAVVCAVLLPAIALLLTRFSAPVWHYVPELAFLQFPWRLLVMLGVVLGVAVALMVRGVRLHASLAAAIVLILISALTATGVHVFGQPCEAIDLPATQAQLLRTHHGVAATDEYTPTDADNDQLRWDDPGFWLAAAPNAPAPGTVPNPAATIVNYDTPPPLDQTVSGRAPAHLDLQLSVPVFLVLNLRAFPEWMVTRNGVPLAAAARDDGLLAFALPAGPSSVDIHWHDSLDRKLGIAISLCALLLLAVDWRRSRKIEIGTHDS